jgi:glycosyltransferase involved in cell wall biosynthesis
LLSGNSDNESEPLVSIIITLYKRKKHISDAINSAIRQENVQITYEIIVISDDPNDPVDELDGFANIKNVYFYRNSQNVGLYNSCNMGAKIARGKYIAFLHDDDILYPNYLFEVYNFISQIKPAGECILINRDVVKNDTKKNISTKIFVVLLRIIFLLPFVIRFFFRKSYKSITLKEGLAYQLSNVYKAPSCGVFFKKNTFMNSGGFNQDLWPVSDYFFFLSFNLTHNIYMIRKKLACYRWFDNLSQNKYIQFSSLELLCNFFKSSQPVKSINRYFRIFDTELLYAKYLMVDEPFRNEIISRYPQMARISKVRWVLFKMYNIFFRFFHDLI